MPKARYKVKATKRLLPNGKIVVIQPPAINLKGTK